MADQEIKKVASKHPQLSGRDVKNLLKLASFSSNGSKTLDASNIEYALQFKPTE